MTIQTLPRIDYYYDSHPTEEDLMGESPLQDLLLFYLVQVLNWLYRAEGWYVARNLDLHYTDDVIERPLAPDIAVFIGTTTKEWVETGRRSWRIHPPLSPPPNVVFEIASDETWTKDVNKKPDKYARWGIREYFFYDPLQSRPSPRQALLGWRNYAGQAEEIQPNERGWLWSEELESWLVPDGLMLRLYDRIEQQRPTAEEAAWAVEEIERAAKERALTSEEVERAAKEAERVAKERAWAYLRSIGVDPDSIP
ncbi:MAG: Uma2 family endonuclease [Armatimonadota bacterium]|nr:Uma2 family endonuclease [Armatimonadota bacterium]